LLPHVLAAAGRDEALNAVPVDATRLLSRATTYLLVRGEPQAAFTVNERSYEVRQQAFGADDPDTLTSASNLALTFGGWASTSGPTALRQTRWVAAAVSSARITLTSAENMAADLRKSGRYEQARALDQDTLVRRRRVLGIDHPDTRTSADNRTHSGPHRWSEVEPGP
jgi:hypothetical protein